MNQAGSQTEVRKVETLVVGAGISGLAYAHWRGPEADLVVLEASDRPGGLMRTERGGGQGHEAADGYRFECGPEAITASNDAVRALFAELDLECETLPATTKQRWIARGGRLVPVPLSPPAFLASPLLSPLAKLRALTEPFRAPRRALDGTVAEFVEHRLGPQVLERLVDPMVAGIHAGDPRDLSVRAAFPRMVELVERHGSLLKGLRANRGGPPPTMVRPTGGVERLARALAQRLGPRLQLGCPVGRLERQPDDGDRPWRIETQRGPVAAKRVVLALPAPAAARLVEGPAPECAAVLGSIRAEGLVCVVHAWERGRVGHPLDGFGYLTPSSEPNGEVLGTLFSSSISPSSTPGPDRVLLRTMLGGARDRAAVERTDIELVERCVNAARGLLGLEGEPLWTDVRRWPGALPSYSPEHHGRMGRLPGLLPDGLALLGNYAGGVGVSALIEKARDLGRDG